jgi:hypothetical protein
MLLYGYPLKLVASENWQSFLHKKKNLEDHICLCIEKHEMEEEKKVEMCKKGKKKGI